MKEFAQAQNQHDGPEDKRRCQSKHMVDRQAFLAFHADRIFFDLALVPDQLIESFLKILTLAQRQKQLVRIFMSLLQILFVPQGEKTVDLSRQSGCFFLVI